MVELVVVLWLAIWVALGLVIFADDIRPWAIRMSEHYPARWWWPVIRIYGGPLGQAGPCYMTRVVLCPKTPWGQLYLHVFHRQDIDRDPHDHPFEFWTMPVNKGYVEEVFEHGMGQHCFRLQHVARLRIHYRHASHTHRILSVDRGTWPLVTLVWRGPTQQRWGFWCYVERARREWIPYQSYFVSGGRVSESVANQDGDADVNCPGYTKE